jgi:hypothetical protein
MQSNPLEYQMTKQIAVSMQSIEWFLLYGFLKNLIDNEEAVKFNFKSAEDCVAIEAILTKIQKQFAPNIASNTDDVPDIEDLLGISPKQLHTKVKKLIV